MMVVANAPFHDIEAGVDRKAGDRFEATPERLAAINSTEFGELARKCDDAPRRRAARKDA